MQFDTASPRRSNDRRPGLWSRRIAMACLALGLSVTGASAQLFGSDSAGDTQRRQAELNLRIQQLEGQMRGLNGQIEQLNFQIRQMQELLTRMQKDTDFRLQEIENAQSKRPPPKRTDASPHPSAADDDAAAGSPRSSSSVPMIAAAAPALTQTAVAPAPGSSPLGPLTQGQPRAGPGAPPQVFGQLPAADDPLGGADGVPLDLGAPRAVARAGQDPDVPPGVRVGPGAPRNAGLIPAVPPRYQNVPPVARPSDEYDAAYGYILNGEYELAETSFRTFLANHPTDRRVGSAQYWLGESFFARSMHREAADAFLKSYTQYPDGPKAPDSLLKLGLALQGLGERKAACATYDELITKYPKASRQLRDRAQAEKTRGRC